MVLSGASQALTDTEMGVCFLRHTAPTPRRLPRLHFLKDWPQQQRIRRSNRWQAGVLRRSNGQNAALEDKPRCKPEHDTKADADSHIGQSKAHRSFLGSETLRAAARLHYPIGPCTNCDEQSRASGGTAAILCVTHDAGLRSDGDEISPKAAAELGSAAAVQAASSD